jgi:hypothetical protein
MNKAYIFIATFFVVVAMSGAAVSAQTSAFAERAIWSLDVHCR